MGCSSNTLSASNAALSAIRRAPQLGQILGFSSNLPFTARTLSHHGAGVFGEVRQQLPFPKYRKPRRYEVKQSFFEMSFVTALHQRGIINVSMLIPTVKRIRIVFVKRSTLSKSLR